MNMSNVSSLLLPNHECFRHYLVCILNPSEPFPNLNLQRELELTNTQSADDDPLNGDLHIVIPGRFVAFKGPKFLDKRLYLDDKKV